MISNKAGTKTKIKFKDSLFLIKYKCISTNCRDYILTYNDILIGKTPSYDNENILINMCNELIFFSADSP